MDTQVHFTFNLWISPNYRAFLGIVAHRIGPQHIFTQGLLRDPEEWVEIVGDGRIMRSIGAGKTAGDGGGPPGTTRVMSHDTNLAVPKVKALGL